MLQDLEKVLDFNVLSGGGLLRKCLILMALSYSFADKSDWSYDDQDAWGGDCHLCKQSPIDLRVYESLPNPYLTLKFHYYDTPLVEPLTLRNNGHSAELIITDTVDEIRSSFSDRNNEYQAQSLHFHWGAPSSTKGSEHFINGKQFDMEMHIVHKNTRYETLDEALKHSDGLSVLGIMFKIVEDPDEAEESDLNIIYEQLPNIVSYQSTVNVTGTLTLSDLLGGVNTKSFFTYDGSLTTPNCSQAVIWYVFSEPIAIAKDDLAEFWNLLNSHDNQLVNNYRDLQKRNNRMVFYTNSI